MSERANSDDQRPWPNEIDAILAEGLAVEDRAVEDRAVEGPAEVGNRQRGSGLAEEADRWSVGSATVYRFAAADGLGGFVDALAALNNALGGEIVSFAIGPVLGSYEEWLVTSRPEGQPGHRPELHADPDDLVTAMGRGLAELHGLELPASALAEANAGLVADPDDVIVERCTAAVEAGLIDSATLPHPYDRYKPDELLAMFIEGRSVLATADEPDVWCHGAAVAERFMVHGGSFTGFDRMESPVLANRHVDLATMHRSVQLHFGPEAVFRFYEAYGRDPGLALLEHHILGSHLMAGPQS